MRKVAIITGATSGLGKAYAIRLASLGYDLILTGRRQEVIVKVAEEIKRTYKVRVTVCIVDFSHEVQTRKFVHYVETLERVDCLVNNAGYGATAAFTQDTLEAQCAMLDVHNKVAITLAYLVAQKMKAQRSGMIIQVSSLAGELVLPQSAMYCATKAFLTSFTQSLALELRPFDIKVQVLCPGFVHTDFHSRLDDAQFIKRSIGPIRWMKADRVVRESLKALHTTKQVVYIPGRWNRVGYQFLKVFPKKVYYFCVLEANSLLKFLR